MESPSPDWVEASSSPVDEAPNPELSDNSDNYRDSVTDDV